MEAEAYGYESAMGRAYWPSRDPIEEKGGMNTYGMVRNNPVNWWDYLGLTPPSCEDFKKHYPNYQDNQSGDVYDQVGGWLDHEHDSGNADYQNSCALRVSLGLNGCGGDHTIPSNAPGANRVPDGKTPKDRQIISARKMCQHLEQKWGPPNYTTAGTPQDQIDSYRNCDCFCIVYCNDTHTGFIDETGKADSNPIGEVKMWKLPCGRGQ
jgi:hypothetical protein